MRRIVALLPALALVFFAFVALTGCGGAPPAAPPPAAETPQPAPTPPVTPTPPPVPPPLPEIVIPDLPSSVEIHFGPNVATFAGLAADVVSNNEEGLRYLAAVFNAQEGFSLRIAGHANPTTPPGTPERIAEQAVLDALSYERARVTLERLVALGVDRSRLSAQGFGGNNPLAGYHDRDNWWRNRRVELIPVR